MTKITKLVTVGIMLICYGYGPLIFGKDSSSASNVLDVTIKLITITVEQTSEDYGDEIYFDLVQYYDGDVTPRYQRVPMFPLYWRSNTLKKVDNTILLQTTLPLGTKQEIVLSLAEYDGSALALDDHLGSVKINIANDGGKLIAVWSIPELSDNSKVTRIANDIPRFILSGDGGRYVAEFAVTATAVVAVP